MKRIATLTVLIAVLSAAADAKQLPTTDDKAPADTAFLHNMLTATVSDLANIREGRTRYMSPDDSRLNCRLPFHAAMFNLGDSEFCIPTEDEDQQVDQAVAAFLTWAKQAPGRGDEPALDSIVSVLSQRYPCSRASDGPTSTD